MGMRSLVAAGGATGALVFVLVAGGPVLAQADPEPTPEAVAQISSRAPAANPPSRGFLFTVDPTLPSQWQVVATAGMGNVTRSGEERPVGAGQIVPTLGAEVGLVSRLSLYAEGGMAFVQATNPGQISSPVIFEGGAHILLTDPASRMWQVSLRPSYSYDFDGSSTLNFTVTGGWQYAGFRVVASAMGSHTFADSSDPVDIQATVGATYALPYGFRVGLEGVVADLEEIAQAGAEGGTSAFAGPTVGWEWQRFQIVAGPAFGVTPGAIYDAFLFRAAASVRL